MRTPMRPVSASSLWAKSRAGEHVLALRKDGELSFYVSMATGPKYSEIRLARLLRGLA